MEELLAKVKMSFIPPIATDDFDEGLTDLINAALLDLGLAGVSEREITDPLVIQAVKTYCNANFGDPEQYDRLKKSYDEQKAQLSMATGYTDWSSR